MMGNFLHLSLGIFEIFLFRRWFVSCSSPWPHELSMRSGSWMEWIISSLFSSSQAFCSGVSIIQPSMMSLPLSSESCMLERLIGNVPREQGSWDLHGAHLGRQGPGGPHVGPMNLVIRVTICAALKAVSRHDANFAVTAVLTTALASSDDKVGIVMTLGLQ